jgi:hypothetical protein
VAADNLIETPFDGGNIQLARQSDSRGQIERGVAGIQLVEQPQALLCKRKWK